MRRRTPSLSSRFRQASAAAPAPELLVALGEAALRVSAYDVAQGALEATRAYVKERRQFGKALARLLRTHGFEVVTFTDGAEFLQVCASRLPDCLLLDLDGTENKSRLGANALLGYSAWRAATQKYQSKYRSFEKRVSIR